MKQVGIVGNIAAGKSEVEKILTRLNYKVICADKITHELFENDNEVRAAVLKEFGTLNRSEIAPIVFSDDAKRRTLEGIIHPRVKTKIKEFFLENKGESLVFASVPLLYEANMQKMFDAVVLIAADDEIRLKRLMKRDKAPGEGKKELARAKMAAQMPQEAKIKLADFVIENNSDLAALEKETLHVLKELEN